MSNSSSAGDNLGISVGRNPTMGSSVKVWGWFEIKHWCAETGVTTDHSGPNSIGQHGLDRMLEGFSAVGTAVTAGPYILLSAATTVVTAGIVGTLQTANEGFSGASPGAVIGTGATEMWTGSGTDSLFAGQSPAGTTTRTLAGDNIILTCDTASTDIGTIQLVDRAGTPASSLVLAQRSSNGSSDTASSMDLIQMNVSDTLSITYSISVAASTT